MSYVIGIVICAAGWRLRGSESWREWTGLGGFWAKLLAWALPVGAFTYWQTGAPYESVAMGIAAFVMTAIGWHDSLDLGRQHNTWLRDFVVMGGAGLIGGLPMALAAFVAFGLWWPLLLAGLACPFIYEIGYRIDETKGTIIAEWVRGGLIGLALTFSLSDRTPWFL